MSKKDKNKEEKEIEKKPNDINKGEFQNFYILNNY